MPEPRTRADILDRAKVLTCGDRENTYGPPTEDYRDVAAMASAMLSHKLKEPLTAHEAALFMALVKIRRCAHNPGHADSYDDGAAYIAIAGECASHD